MPKELIIDQLGGPQRGPKVNRDFAFKRTRKLAYRVSQWSSRLHHYCSKREGASSNPGLDRKKKFFFMPFICYLSFKIFFFNIISRIYHFFSILKNAQFILMHSKSQC